LAAWRDTAELNLEDLGDAQALAVLDVPPGSTVLFVRAGDSSAPAQLRQRGCTVTEATMADLAQADGSFDAVLLLDCLQRVEDPEQLLRAAGRLLGPSGRLLVSVPNATHAALRLLLLAGRLPASPTQRPIDRPGLEEIIVGADLRVLDRMRTTRGLTETDVDVDPQAFAPETLAQAMGDPDAETYELLYVLASGPGASAPAGESLTEALQQRLHQAERLRSEAEAHVGALEERLAELGGERDRRQSLEHELTQRMQELERLHEEIEHARLDVAVKESQIATLRAELAPLKLEHERMAKAQRLLSRLVYWIVGYLRRFPALRELLESAAGRPGDEP
jgi:SAM-dependent methyltransferase